MVKISSQSDKRLQRKTRKFCVDKQTDKQTNKLTQMQYPVPGNICSSSAPIVSSDHMLVKVDISLAVIREPPQRRRVWHFTQAEWQGLQAAIKHLDWSPVSTFSDINSSWEFFQRNLLSLMHRFIPSHLQLSDPSSHPWVTEAGGESSVLKQLAFASWKANPTEGNLSSFHKARNKCVSTI